MDIVVGITGASGAIYAKRTVELLTRAGVRVHLSVTTLGRRVLQEELGLSGTDSDALSGGRGQLVEQYKSADLGALIASGSFRHDGMIIVPCSSNTLGSLAAGITQNLVQRAASVTLKERRRLILAHRETPLSPIDLANMQRLSEAGAVIVPLCPGFYLRPTSVEELVDFMVGRLLDLVGAPHELHTRWQGEPRRRAPAPNRALHTALDGALDGFDSADAEANHQQCE